MLPDERNPATTRNTQQLTFECLELVAARAAASRHCGGYGCTNLLTIAVKGANSGAAFPVCGHVNRIHCAFITTSTEESASAYVRMTCTDAFANYVARKGEPVENLLEGELLAC
eukprot:734297-Pleurochrysis_carterae.AAC.24